MTTQEHTHTPATLVDSSGAYDATIDSPESRALTTNASATRTTVLPRVEGTGAEATVVATARPRFERTRALGAGGLGEVVAAVDHDIGREVAIKRLRRDVSGSAAVARFVDEIRTLGSLEHPNILPIHDVGADEDGSLYFVMPCVKGETLETIIERLQAGDPLAHAHWTFERRVHLFRQLLDAVSFAHAHGVVHRDIKPANVMVGPYGEVFLMDWGIAKASRANVIADAAPDAGSLPGRVTETIAGSVVGTPAYMSPEQARGEKVDVRSDVYSLSVLFHELLGLKHYLDHCKTVEEMLVAAQHFRAPMVGTLNSPHQTTVPFELSWYVHKGLQKDPALRYQTVREMMDRLDAREEGIIPVQCPVTFTKRATREWLRIVDRHPFLFMAFFTLAVFGGIGSMVWRLLAH